MTDPIAEAHAIIPKLDANIPTRTYWTYENYFNAAALLPAILDEAEKWRAIAIAERAYILSCNVLESQGVDEVHLKSAAQGLAAETGTWRKIGPDEQKVIQNANL